jgi:two-component system, LytTR family, sensor kinase
MKSSARLLSEAHREIVIRRRVLLRAGFMRHFAMYAAVSLVLWGSNLWLIREGGFMQTDKWWAFLPTVAWGFGVLTHGLSVLMSTYTRFPYVSVHWEEERVQAAMQAIYRAGGTP